MATTKMKLIDQEIAAGSQSIELTNILSFGKAKLRVRIKSDSYRDQSYARVELWNGERWNEVASIHSGKMATEKGLCYAPNGRDFRHFEQDYDRLLKLAEAVIS